MSFISKKFAAAALASVLAFAPLSMASAGNISKSAIAESLVESGYSVQNLTSNILSVGVGEHIVLVAIDGPDADVSYITYLEEIDLGQGGASFLSKFNSKVKFGRAYIDRDGDVTLQMDRNSTGGVSLENIESDFDVFLLLISKFLSDYQSQGSV